MSQKVIDKEKALQMLKKAAAGKPKGYKYPEALIKLANQAGEVWAEGAGPEDISCTYEEIIGNKKVHCIIGDILVNQMKVSRYVIEENNTTGAVDILEAIEEEEDVDFDLEAEVLFSFAQQLQDENYSWDEVFEMTQEFSQIMEIPTGTIDAPSDVYWSKRLYLLYRKLHKAEHDINSLGPGPQRSIGAARRLLKSHYPARAHSNRISFNIYKCPVTGCSEEFSF